MSPKRPIPAATLPLKADVFMVLLSLLDGDRHGYAIIQDAEQRSGGTVRLQPGALYRLLKRLLEEGLVEEISQDGSGDDRRRVYRITHFGAQTASAEARRMAGLVEDSKAHDLLDEAKWA